MSYTPYIVAKGVLYVVRSNPNAGTGKARHSRTARREKPTLLSRKVKPNQKADNEPTREEKSKKKCLIRHISDTLVSPAFNTVKMAWVAGGGSTARCALQRALGSHTCAVRVPLRPGAKSCCRRPTSPELSDRGVGEGLLCCCCQALPSWHPSSRF